MAMQYSSVYTKSRNDHPTLWITSNDTWEPLQGWMWKRCASKLSS